MCPHLNDVPQQAIGCGVGLLDLPPLPCQTQLRALEHQVRQLPTWHLVVVHVRTPAFLPRLEGCVQSPTLLPVLVHGVDRFHVHACVVGGMPQGTHNGAEGGLAGGPGECVHRRVHGVRARLGAGNHGRHPGPGRVMRVQVQGNVRELLPQAANQQGGRLRLQQPRHIFHGQDVDPESHQLAGEFQVVVEGVGLAVRVCDVPRVADRRFHDPARGAHGVNAQSHVLQIIQGIKDSKHVHPMLLSQLAEFKNHIVGVGGVPDGVRAPEQHLERDVRHRLPHGPKSVPGVFAQKSHGHVKGRTTPIFQGIGRGQGNAGRLGNAKEVAGAHAGGQEGLMGVPPCSVGDEGTFVLSHRLRESFRSPFQVDLPKAFLFPGRERRKGGNYGVDGGTRRTRGSQGGLWPIDDDVADELQKLLSAVRGPHGLQESRITGDEAGIDLAVDKVWMGKQVEDK